MTGVSDLLPRRVLVDGLRVAVALRWEEAWALIRVTDQNRTIVRAKGFQLTDANRTAANSATQRYDAVTRDVRQLQRAVIRRG